MKNKQAILESAKFALYFGDRMRDELSDEELAILAIYVKDLNKDTEDAWHYVKSILRPHIDHVINRVSEEDYKGEFDEGGFSPEDDAYEKHRQEMIDRGET